MRDVAGGKAVGALIEAVERGDQLFFVVVCDVELQTKAESGGFERALPSAFRAEDGFGFAAGGAGGFAVERDGNGESALAPGALEGLVAGG